MKTFLKSMAAGLMCLAGVNMAQAADNVINIEYKVPTDLNLVTGKGAGRGAFIYKKASLQSPKLVIDGDLVEGAGVKWSNELKSRKSYNHGISVNQYELFPRLGSSGNFIQVAYGTYFGEYYVGYVEKSKTVAVTMQPVTLDDFEKDENTQVISKGVFKDCVAYCMEGEGGVYDCYVGRIHNGMAVIFASFSAQYSEDESRFRLYDDNYFIYGDNCSFESEFINPLIDLDSLTDQDWAKVLKNKKHQYNIVAKCNNELKLVFVPLSLVPTETVTFSR